MEITTIGLDLAKNIIQAHGVTAGGQVAIKRALRRGQVLRFFERLAPCLVGMEACGTSHYWARELMKLGHDVRLMPPIYVKPYVKRGKTDAADAEAICEAVTRPTMRFVAVKSPEQQALLSLHRARDLIVRQRTHIVNMLRGLLAEFGCAVAKGIESALVLARALLASDGRPLPDVARQVTVSLCKQLLDLNATVRWFDKQVIKTSQGDARIKLLETIPGIGPVTASAIVATVGTPDQFGSGREFAAWLGLTPLKRWQGAAWADLQDGGSVHTQTSGRRHDVQSAGGNEATRSGRSMARLLARTQADTPRDRRYGKQNCADHLGRAHPK
jgi:transposase